MITIGIGIDNKSPAEKTMGNDLRRYWQVMNFAEHQDTPEGYLTGDEFVNECKSFVTEYYLKNGLL